MNGIFYVFFSFFSITFVEFEFKAEEHLHQRGKVSNDFASPTILNFKLLELFFRFKTIRNKINNKNLLFSSDKQLNYEIASSVVVYIPSISARFVKDAQYHMYEIIQNNDDIISFLSHRLCVYTN